MDIYGPLPSNHHLPIFHCQDHVVTHHLPCSLAALANALAEVRGNLGALMMWCWWGEAHQTALQGTRKPPQHGSPKKIWTQHGGFHSHGGSPSHHPFDIGIFPNKNYPAIYWSTPIFLWKIPKKRNKMKQSWKHLVDDIWTFGDNFCHPSRWWPNQNSHFTMSKKTAFGFSPPEIMGKPTFSEGEIPSNQMVENFSHEMLKLEVSMGIWWGYGKQLNMGWKWWIVSYVLLWKVKILTVGTNQIMFLIFKCYVIPCYISSKNSTSNICPHEIAKSCPLSLVSLLFFF